MGSLLCQFIKSKSLFQLAGTTFGHLVLVSVYLVPIADHLTASISLAGDFYSDQANNRTLHPQLQCQLHQPKNKFSYQLCPLKRGKVNGMTHAHRSSGECDRAKSTEVPLVCILAEAILGLPIILSPWWKIPWKTTKFYPRTLKSRCHS